MVGYEPTLSNESEGPGFTEVDFNSEIVFDASTVAEEDHVGDDGETQIMIDDGTEVPMEICFDESDPDKRREMTKPRVCDPAGK